MSSFDEDRFAALTAAETNNQAARNAGTPLVLFVGTAESNTDEDGTVQVTVDAPESEGASDEDTPTDLPITARCWGRYVAQGERVHGLFSAGTAYVVGSGGDGGEGQPDTIGAASIEPTTDIAIASTAQVQISGLEAECSVLHPNHLVEINVNVHLQSGAAANLLTGRVIRIDSEGDEVEVGRWLRNSALANNQTVQGGVPVFDFAPDPGDYIYVPSVQASVTGWSLILSPATSPLTVASCVVTDRGPLPVSWAAT